VNDIDPKRVGYVMGLRALADVLERNPDVPLPYQGITSPIVTYFLHTENPRAELATAARAYPCDFRKEYEGDGEGATFRLAGKLHGLNVELVAYRNAVCERVVTGTREVTEKVKDPEALAAVPEIEVTKTVEDVSWVCSPILAPAANAEQDATVAA
jgi:hypothetical protein